jgi:hypothetical protein
VLDLGTRKLASNAPNAGRQVAVADQPVASEALDLER